MKLRVKKLREDAVIPTRGTKASAGYDLYAVEDYEVNVGEAVKVNTGIALAIDKEGAEGTYALMIYARSGLACKYGLAPANKVGIVDEDYRGEVIVALYNQSQQKQSIKKGDRVAQIVIQRVEAPDIELVDDLDNTERGTRGFGSTGR